MNFLVNLRRSTGVLLHPVVSWLRRRVCNHKYYIEDLRRISPDCVTLLLLQMRETIVGSIRTGNLTNLGSKAS